MGRCAPLEEGTGGKRGEPRGDDQASRNRIRRLEKRHGFGNPFFSHTHPIASVLKKGLEGLEELELPLRRSH